MSKVGLLGGSNSIIKDGFIKGLNLTGINDIHEMALGGSSSIQNLAKLVQNFSSLKEYDCVITESNVNDIHAHNVATSLEQILLQIDDLYQHLSYLSIPVIVLILPTFDRFRNISEINGRHKENCERFGFHLLNVVDVLEPYKSQFCLMKDDLHPNVSLMQYIGYKVSEYINSGLEKNSVAHNHDTVRLSYTYISAKCIFLGDPEVKSKSNSKFKARYVEILSPLQVSNNFEGFTIAAIETWCDKNSKLKIINGRRAIIKCCNSNLIFNELNQELIIDEKTFFDCGNLEVETEKTMNIRVDSSFIGKPLVSGILLRDDSINRPLPNHDFKGVVDINFILKDIPTIINIAESETRNLVSLFNNLINLGHYRAALELIRYEKDRHLLPPIIRAFERLKVENVHLAHEFIKQALVLNPDGKIVRDKLRYIKTRINDLEQNRENAYL